MELDNIGEVMHPKLSENIKLIAGGQPACNLFNGKTLIKMSFTSFYPNFHMVFALSCSNQEIIMFHVQIKRSRIVVIFGGQ